MKEETCREKESYSSKEGSSSIVKDSGDCGKLKACNGKKTDNSTNCGLKITYVDTNRSADSFDKEAVCNESASDKKCTMTSFSSSATVTSTITGACIIDKGSLIINKVPPTTEIEASNCSTSVPPSAAKCTNPSKNITFKKGGGAVKGKRVYRKRTSSGDLRD